MIIWHDRHHNGEKHHEWQQYTVKILKSARHRQEDVQYGVNLDITSYTNGMRETHNPPGRALPYTVWDFYKVTCAFWYSSPCAVNFACRLSVIAHFRPPPVPRVAAPSACWTPRLSPPLCGTCSPSFKSSSAAWREPTCKQLRTVVVVLVFLWRPIAHFTISCPNQDTWLHPGHKALLRITTTLRRLSSSWRERNTGECTTQGKIDGGHLKQPRMNNCGGFVAREQPWNCSVIFFQDRRWGLACAFKL